MTSPRLRAANTSGHRGESEIVVPEVPPTPESSGAPGFTEVDPTTAGRRALREHFRASGQSRADLRNRRERRERPDRDEIEAALRGTVRATPEIAEVVARLDASLEQFPADQAMVVRIALGPDADLSRYEPGVQIYEPSYLEGTRVVRRRARPQGHAEVLLTVVPGTPVLRQEVGDGVLLTLGRGIAWVVDQVAPFAEGIRVVGRMIGREPMPLVIPARAS